MGFAEAMILEYNGKKKTSAGKLFINKLYARDVSRWIEPDEDEDFSDIDIFDDIDAEYDEMSLDDDTD